MKKVFLTSFLFVFVICTPVFGTQKTQQKEQKVLIETTLGDVVVKLYNETPLHRDNFIKLVKSNFYDSLLFHRVISEFMIQGGDPESKKAQPDVMLGNGDVGYKVSAEFKIPTIFHKKGVLAAAREGDDVNPEKASSGCQFYIVVGKIFTDKDLDMMEFGRKNKLKIQLFQQIAEKKQSELKENIKLTTQELDNIRDSVAKLIEQDVYAGYKFTSQQREVYKTVGGTPHLDGSYTVFGEVLEGMDVVEKISKVKTNTANRPLDDVRIIKMKLIR